MMKYAVTMNLPDGKLPGYYAQIVKALAGVGLYDRDKELLIVEAESQLVQVEAVLDRYQIAHDRLNLLELPQDTTLGPMLDGCGFTSRSDHTYVFSGEVRSFLLSETDSADHAAAREQLQEHLVASYQSEQRICYVVESHQAQLVEGIASAYGVSISWLEAME